MHIWLSRAEDSIYIKSPQGGRDAGPIQLQGRFISLTSQRLLLSAINPKRTHHFGPTLVTERQLHRQWGAVNSLRAPHTDSRKATVARYMPLPGNVHITASYVRWLWVLDHGPSD